MCGKTEQIENSRETESGRELEDRRCRNGAGRDPSPPLLLLLHSGGVGIMGSTQRLGQIEIKGNMQDSGC